MKKIKKITLVVMLVTISIGCPCIETPELARTDSKKTVKL